MVLRQGKHAHTEHHDSCVELSDMRLQSKLLSFALLPSNWTQTAKNVIDTMSFKSKKEVPNSLESHISSTRLQELLSKQPKSIVAAWSPTV